VRDPSCTIVLLGLFADVSFLLREKEKSSILTGTAAFAKEAPMRSSSSSAFHSSVVKVLSRQKRNFFCFHLIASFPLLVYNT
jgi:hypothetical protein